MTSKEICEVLNKGGYDGAVDHNRLWKHSGGWFYHPFRVLGIKRIDAERIALSYVQAEEIERLKRLIGRGSGNV